MKTSTVIGRSSFVNGRVSGAGDLEIAGRVEGDVTVTGEVVVDPTGLVDANISATRIVVRGAVKGDLVADETLHIEAGAKVVGDLRAPRIAIAPGGLVRGHVQTGSGGAARPRAAASARAAEPRAETKPRPLAAPLAAVTVSRPMKAPVKEINHHKPAAPGGAALASSRVGPPAPVVPVLKKGTKAVQKKHR